MKVMSTALSGVLIIEPQAFQDERGWFFEAFHAERYRQEADISLPFVQDNCSRSKRGVLRGIHAQQQPAQGKLVYVVHGEIFDVAVDIEPRSPTFGRWVGVTLSAANHRQIWIPPGYAHGYAVLSDIADVSYKCTAHYQARAEIGVVWNDPDLGIPWPIDDPTLSEKDEHLPTLAQLAATA